MLRRQYSGIIKGDKPVAATKAIPCRRQLIMTSVAFLVVREDTINQLSEEKQPESEQKALEAAVIMKKKGEKKRKKKEKKNNNKKQQPSLIQKGGRRRSFIERHTLISADIWVEASLLHRILSSTVMVDWS